MVAPTRSFLFAGFAASQACAGWGVPPAGWEDFRFAIVDDNTKTETLREALKTGTRIYGHYRYLNGGVDPKTNWYTFSGPDGATLTNFEKNSQSLGIRSSFVVYMLQEEGGYGGFKSNVNSQSFMKDFFWNLQWIAKTMAGKGTVYVLEADTWGYLLQEEHGRGVSLSEFGKAIANEPARVNDLGYPGSPTFPTPSRD